MNRILERNGKFFVLLTPSYISSPSNELMLGNWTDEHLRNYHTVEYNNLNDAMACAYKFTPLDWNKIVSIHEDAYHTIVHSIENYIRTNKYFVELEPVLMNPTELKETMFHRVAQKGHRFSLFYDMNDVVCINIVNNWTKILSEIAKGLMTIPSLRIKKFMRTDTFISLIGVTDVGTTYEIRLWSSLVHQWAKWIYMNKSSPYQYIDTLNELIEKQKQIDNGTIIR